MKEFGTREPNKKYRDRPGAYGLIVNGGHVLVLEVEGKHFLPGGGSNANEGPEETLRREILEETGHAIDIQSKVAEAAQYLFSLREQSYYKKIGHFYKCSLLHQQTRPVDVSHVMEWMEPSQAVERLTYEFQSWVVGQLAELQF